MTLPDERYRAVKWARNFMFDLCDPKKTPGVPRAVRDQARSILRHYPNDWDMSRASDACPDVFQEQMEAVTRLLAQYEQSKKANDNSPA
jgi:hypothetical protein